MFPNVVTRFQTANVEARRGLFVGVQSPWRLASIGDNGEGDKAEAKRDVHRALHIGLGCVGFHFKDWTRV